MTVRLGWRLQLPVALLSLGGCAIIPAAWLGGGTVAPAPTQSAAPPRPGLGTGCPGPVVVPVAPKAPRSVEAIAAYATRLDEALVKSERARAACAAALQAIQAAP